MSELSLKTLDDILKVMIRDGTEPIDLEYLITKEFPKINPRDRKIIREKLIEDKYISSFVPALGSDKFLSDREYQCINFNGIFLLNKGGYVGKNRKEKFLRTLQLWLTILIALGTAVAALYYILQMMNFH